MDFSVSGMFWNFSVWALSEWDRLCLWLAVTSSLSSAPSLVLWWLPAHISLAALELLLCSGGGCVADQS